MSALDLRLMQDVCSNRLTRPSKLMASIFWYDCKKERIASKTISEFFTVSKRALVYQDIS